MRSARKVFADTTPLQNKDFRLLWTSGIVTVIGAQLSLIAAPQQIFEITRSSAYVGLAGIFGFVPLVVFGLWGGALADSMDRRRLVMITTAGLVLTSVLFWLQAAAGNRNVWVVLVLLAVQQALFAINQPTRSAIVPRLLPPDQLAAANSLTFTVFQFGSIAGPVIAGAMIPVIGLPSLYLIDSIALLITFAAVARLPKLPPMHDSPRANWRSILDGFTYLRTQTVLLASFVVDIIAMVFGMSRAVFPQVAHETFGDPAAGGMALGALYAAMSIGAVAGGVFSGWLPRIERQGLAVLVCIGIWGVAMVAFGGVLFGAPADAGWVWLVAALVSLAVGGAADMISAALRMTMLQSVATDEVRGRLQGVFTVVVAGGPRIGDVTHGFAAAAAGTAIACGGGGVLVIVGIVASAMIFRSFTRYRVESLPPRSAVTADY